MSAQQNAQYEPHVKLKVTMAKRLARVSDDKENDPDLDDFKSSKKSKTVKRFGSPTSESRMAEITKGFVPFNTKHRLVYTCMA